MGQAFKICPTATREISYVENPTYDKFTMVFTQISFLNTEGHNFLLFLFHGFSVWFLHSSAIGFFD